MKIAHLVSSLEEARRNNFGREVSNQQGQNLGKRLAAGDPAAQSDLAAAKAAQATNQTDAGADALGQTTPAQRLAAKKAAAGAGGAAFGNIANTLGGAAPAVDPNAPTTSSTGGTTTPTDTGLTHAAAATNPNQPPAAAPAAVPGQPQQAAQGQQPSAMQKLGGQVAAGIKAAPAAIAGAAGSAIGGFAGGMRRGYNAQSGKAAGSYTPRSGGGAAQIAAPVQGDAGGAVQALSARIDALEKRIGATAEGFTFESKFLGMKI